MCNGVDASNVYGYCPLTLVTRKSTFPKIQGHICLTVKGVITALPFIFATIYVRVVVFFKLLYWDILIIFQNSTATNDLA